MCSPEVIRIPVVPVVLTDFGLSVHEQPQAARDELSSVSDVHPFHAHGTTTTTHLQPSSFSRCSSVSTGLCAYSGPGIFSNNSTAKFYDNTNYNTNAQNNNNNSPHPQPQQHRPHVNVGSATHEKMKKRGAGTRPYMAPECWYDLPLAGECTTKMDIWSLGCLLFGICTNKLTKRRVCHIFDDPGAAAQPPRYMYEVAVEDKERFAATILRHLTQPPAAAGSQQRRERPAYSLALASFILFLLVVDPARRPSGDEVLRCFKVAKVKRARRQAREGSEEDTDDGDGEEEEEVQFNKDSPFFCKVLNL
ncbi:hypothetical protein STCU_11230 [Strigomonas culicis]|uniref:non-specific serine/threonine protein kinase n=1 Tax=Strigomonas culicis TaxID=28005 RepID=S9V0X8_9TRYP|nr:hypothetical protein STCU_11230 [Strigomonas culicis]|eukprot:EPY16465.1 hypothetical protein STCU_11230 [Strigomonas culicis]